MFVPSFLVVLPCLACFLLCGVRYYQANPERRLTDHRFVVSAAAVATVFAFLLARIVWPHLGLLPAGFLLLALGWLGCGVWIFRQPLQPAKAPVPTQITG